MGALIRLGAVAAIAGVSAYGVHELVETNQPQESRIYVSDTGRVSRLDINGNANYGHIDDPTKVLAEARQVANRYGLPVGVGKWAVGWAGDGQGFDPEHCAMYQIKGKGGDPTQKHVDYVVSLGEEACKQALPYVEAAAVAGPNGVTPNIARFPAPVPAQTTPTPNP